MLGAVTASGYRKLLRSACFQPRRGGGPTRWERAKIARRTISPMGDGDELPVRAPPLHAGHATRKVSRRRQWCLLAGRDASRFPATWSVRPPEYVRLVSEQQPSRPVGCERCPRRPRGCAEGACRSTARIIESGPRTSTQRSTTQQRWRRAACRPAVTWPSRWTS